MRAEEKIAQLKNRKLLGVWDIVVVCVIAVIALIPIAVWLTDSGADEVEIRYAGQVSRYILDVDCEITVKEGFVVVIENGTVYVSQSDCETQRCTIGRWGKISLRSQSIVCSPNDIVITIIGDRGENDLDGITGQV